ncbi:DUF397 domain-containing protein [Streptomyces johnsoniae]|uniref:DUF397 domain-containing protein n=1 Tax=Streptomyces johnsoniae TaxID=3075532 RepID=A0ABU2RYV7_9ACTN|nr:DUF397 domain-containing protein [Streptomyces sp. DSM 41886]MDT0441601.1 DUF397 domain-containing protein [Streptomyces sp. DSM 41886]
MQQIPEAYATAAWRKSSYSNGDVGECLEVVGGMPVVPVRDSKVRGGAILAFGPGPWSGFVTAVKDGRLSAG